MPGGNRTTMGGSGLTPPPPGRFDGQTVQPPRPQTPPRRRFRPDSMETNTSAQLLAILSLVEARFPTPGTPSPAAGAGGANGIKRKSLFLFPLGRIHSAPSPSSL